MYGIEWLLGIGGGGLLVGLVVGYLLKQFAFGGSKKEADLQTSLEQAQEELVGYRQQVHEQFSQTADRFKDLNDAYQALHQQLATSAVTLCGDAPSVPLIPAASTAAVAAAVVSSETGTQVDAEQSEQDLKGEVLQPAEMQPDSAEQPESSENETSALDEGSQPASQQEGETTENEIELDAQADIEVAESGAEAAQINDTIVVSEEDEATLTSQVPTLSDVESTPDQRADVRG